MVKRWVVTPTYYMSLKPQLPMVTLMFVNFFNQIGAYTNKIKSQIKNHSKHFLSMH